MKKLYSFVCISFVFAALMFIGCQDVNNSVAVAGHSGRVISVEFNANGGSISFEQGVAVIGSTIIEYPDVSRAGYIFNNWNTKADGTGIVYDKNSIVTDPGLVLYATWVTTGTSYRINLNYSKASNEYGLTITNSPSSYGSVALGSNNFTVSTKVVVNNGLYVLNGYYTQAGIQVVNSLGELLPDVAPYTDSTGKWIYKTSNYAITFYADWTKFSAAESMSIPSVVALTTGQTTVVPITLTPEDSLVSISDYNGTSARSVCYYRYDQILKNLIVQGMTPGTKTLTIKDNNTGMTQNVQFVTTIDPNLIDGTYTVTDLAPKTTNTLDDCIVVDIASNKQAFIYEIELEKGIKYCFETSDSVSSIRSILSGRVDGYFYLYNSSGTLATYMDDSTFTYKCNNTGKYYLVITRYSPQTSGGKAAVHVYAVPTLKFNIPDSVTFNSYGDDLEIPVTWTPYPIDADSNIVLNSSSNNYFTATFTVTGKNEGKIILSGKKYFGTLSTNITLTDTITGKSITLPIKVLPPLGDDGVITANGDSHSSNLEDYTQIEFTDVKQIYSYSIEMTAGRTYYLESADSDSSIISSGRINSYYYLYDKNGNQIRNSDSSFIYTPETTDTYYLIIKPYYSGNTGKNAVRFYSFIGINNLVLSENDLTIKLGEVREINLTYDTPAGYKNPSFSYSASYWRCVISNNGTGFETIKVIGYTVGQYNGYIADNTTGKRINLNCKVILDTENVDGVLDIGNNSSSNIDDYTQFDITSEKQGMVYAVNLVAGRTYKLQTADQNYSLISSGHVDAYYYLYNKNGTQLKSDSAGFTYTPETSDTYYLLIIPSSINYTGKNAVRFYSVITIDNLVLSETSLNLKSGQIASVTLTYDTPEGYAKPSFTFNNNDSSRIAHLKGSTVGNGTETFQVYAKKPGTYNIVITDSISSKTISLPVTVTIDPDNIDAVLTPGTLSNCTDISAATKCTYTNDKQVFVYQIALEANTQYGLKTSDNGLSISGRIDGYWYIIDGAGKQVLGQDDSEQTYTPALTGTYYIIVTPYNTSGNTGSNVFNLYVK